MSDKRKVSPALVTRSCRITPTQAETLRDWVAGRALFDGNWARLSDVLLRAIKLSVADKLEAYEVSIVVDPEAGL